MHDLFPLPLFCSYPMSSYLSRVTGLTPVVLYLSPQGFITVGLFTRCVRYFQQRMTNVNWQGFVTKLHHYSDPG